MTRTPRFSLFALCAALSLGSIALGSAPASAQQPSNCGSNRSLTFVHRRLEGVISQLNADTRDYGGHRVNAVNDLTTARTELDSAEKYAIDTEHQDPACFQTHAHSGGHWGGKRPQGASDYDIAKMNDRVGKLTTQLQGDNDDYGGHKAAALSALQSASTELQAATTYAQQHGN